MVGKEQNVTSQPTSASMSPAVTMGRASWGPASATQGTRARAVKKVFARYIQLAFASVVVT